MILCAAPAESQLSYLPEGAAGIRATLKMMVRLVKAGRTAPPIREAAANISEGTSATYTGEVNALFEFVRDDIRYLGDVNGIETLQTPEYTLGNRFGDCDDKSVLLATLLESIGHPCRFVAVGYTSPGVFEHVWTETLIGREWIACETTQAVPLGWSPTPPNSVALTCLMREYV